MADPAVRRVVLGYRDQAAALRDRVLAFVERSWGGLDSWRTADIDRFAAAVAPVVVGGQRAMASLTDAYLASLATVTLGKPHRPVGVPKDVLDGIRGDVTPVEVYQRTGPTVWTALSQGVPLTEAVGQGLDRALAMASTDLQLAKTHSSRYVLGNSDGVVGYRRVLESGRSCALCIVASTQRYHSEDLMPIHPRCDCGVEPIYGDRDPGQVIDPDVLDNLQDTITERFGSSDAGAREIPGVGGDGKPLRYRDVIVVHEHGEIGPVLTVRGQDFTGPHDV
jgi:hypothetical protein